jgi:hypothetical protein
MHQRCRWSALLLLLPLLLAACGDDDEGAISLYTQGISVSPYGDEVTLDDGTGVRVAVHDEQEIVVQWRPEGESWTQPTTVYSESDHWIHEDVSVTVAGSTLAINPDYWAEQELADDFPPDHSVQLICQGLSCTDGQRTTGDSLAITRFTADGQHAFFQTDDNAAVLWSAEDGEQEVALDGVDDHDEIDLLDDGSLVATRAGRSGDACRLLVSATDGVNGDFSRVAEWGPFPGGSTFADGTVSCSLYEVHAEGDGVTVYLDEFDDEGVAFHRDGDSWTVD